MPQQFHTLSPFPGGNDQYFQTLLAALTWAQQTTNPTREQLAQWFVEHFAVGVSSTPIYIQMLTRLETVTIDGLDRVTLTPFG